MNVNIEEIRTKLKDNYRELRKEYDREIEASYKRKVEATQPGQPAPERGLTSDERSAFNLRVAEYRTRADSILGVAAGELRREVTAAPTPEAAAYIGLLAKREHVSKMEIDAAVAVYGTNFACHEMIREAAQRNDMYIEDHPVGATLRELEALDVINAQTFSDISQPHSSMAMYETAVDNILGLR